MHIVLMLSTDEYALYAQNCRAKIIYSYLMFAFAPHKRVRDGRALMMIVGYIQKSYE